jgi:hypothetical protein
MTPLVFRQMRWAALPTRIRLGVVQAFADRRAVTFGAALHAVGAALQDVESPDWPLLDELLTDALGELQRVVVATMTYLFEGWAAAARQIAAGFATAVEASRAPADGATLTAGGVEAGTAATPGTPRTRPALPAEPSC